MSESSTPRRFVEGLNRPEFADEIQLRERVALWMVYLRDEDVFATIKDVGSTANSPKRCGKTHALDIGGSAFTGANGTAEFLLTDFWCNEFFEFAGILAFEFPVIFVATPQTNAPVFLTSLQDLVPNEPRPIPGPVNNIKFTVFSWDTNGNPRGNVMFDWRCSVPMSFDSFKDKPGTTISKSPL